jgi:hypothetical protein
VGCGAPDVAAPGAHPGEVDEGIGGASSTVDPVATEPRTPADDTHADDAPAADRSAADLPQGGGTTTGSTPTGGTTDHTAAGARRPVDAEPLEVTQDEIVQAASMTGARVEHLMEELIEAELETGKREETIEAAKRHIVVRVIRMVAGFLLLIVGLAMFVLPGPGLIVCAIALGLLAQDVPFARNLLDKVRARLPQDEDGKLPKSTIVMMVVVSVAAVGASIFLTVRQLSAE